MRIALVRHVTAAKNRNQWLALLLAAIAAALFLVFFHSEQVRRADASEQDRLQVLTKVIANDITANLIATNNALNGVVDDHFVLRKALPEAMSRRMHALQQVMPGVRAMIVLDAQGIVIAASNADVIGQSFAQRTYFTTVRDRHDRSVLYLSPPFVSLQKDVVVTVAKMIPAADGGFGGLVAAALDPHYFMAKFQSVMYAPDVWGIVVHGNGQQVLNYPMRASIYDGNFGRPGTFFSRYRESRQSASTLRGTLSTGESRLMAFVTVKPALLNMDHDIVVGLSRSLPAIAAQANQQLLIFAIGFALLLPLCVIWLYRSQVRRAHIEALQATLDAERSEMRFRTLIEDAPLAIAMLRKGYFIYTNLRYRILHGYCADDNLNGLPWRAMIVADSLQRLQQTEALIVADSTSEQMFETQGLGKDGATVPVFKTTTRVVLADGPATLIFAQDISTQKRAEQDILQARDLAEAANRSKAEFLANMSHEIRSPLNAILGLAHILEQSRLSVDAHEMVRKIRTSGRLLLGIINDILDVSKIEAGQMIIEQAPFRLSDLLDNLAGAMGIAIADKEIELIIHPLPANINHISGDALRLEQVLTNLLSNAIKFTHAGRVELTVDLVSRTEQVVMLRFRVRDTGIGIEPDMQSAMFSPFTQADSSTTRRFGGTGLGLAICRQLVTLMGGQIGVSSVVGEGSEFYFTLGFRQVENIEYSSPDMIMVNALIADDSAIALGAMSTIAQGLGWQVSAVDSGEAAMAFLDARKPGSSLPDVVILDWKMPGIDGLETARRIRQDSGKDDFPIVIMATAFALSSLASQPGADLVDAILSKPVTASNLYNAVVQAQRRRLAGHSVSELSMSERGQTLEGVRLLVVDDSDINREVVKRIVEAQGAVVAMAENGQEAVDWLLANADRIDLVLMDVQMPVMDGIEATRVLRKLPQFDDLPIVALTAGAFKSQQDAAQAAGMNYFISKPFDVPLTIALIQRIRRRPHSDATRMPPPSEPLPAVDSDQRSSDEMPVINIARGLQLWSDAARYKQYLRLFVDKYRDAVSCMNADFVKSDPAGAAALAHKLSGVAANLALFGVQRLAAEAERILSIGYDPTAVLAHLDSELLAAVKAIDEFAPESGAAPSLQPGSSAPPSDLAAAARIALEETLRRMLGALDSASPGPAEPLLAVLKTQLPDIQVAALAAFVRDFDFRDAEDETRRLAKQYGIDLHE